MQRRSSGKKLKKNAHCQEQETMDFPKRRLLTRGLATHQLPQHEAQKPGWNHHRSQLPASRAPRAPLGTVPACEKSADARVLRAPCPILASLQ